MLKWSVISLIIIGALIIALWAPMPDPVIKVCNQDNKKLQGVYRLQQLENANDFFEKSLQLTPSYSRFLKATALLTHKQRIEQCGNRFAISFNFARYWAVHKFIADGNMSHGIDDKTAMGEPLAASAIYQNNTLTVTSHRQEGVFISTTKKVNDKLTTRVIKKGMEDTALTMHFKKLQ